MPYYLYCLRRRALLRLFIYSTIRFFRQLTFVHNKKYSSAEIVRPHLSTSGINTGFTHPQKSPVAGAFVCRGLLNPLVFDAVRLVSFVAEAFFAVGFVFAVSAGEEGDLRVAFKGKDVRGDAVEEPAVV